MISGTEFEYRAEVHLAVNQARFRETSSVCQVIRSDLYIHV